MGIRPPSPKNVNATQYIVFSESVPIGWNMRQMVYQDYDNGYPFDKLGISEDGWLYPNMTECNIESPKHRLKLTKVE